MSPMPVYHFDRLQNNYVSRKPSHNLPSEIQENHAQQHGTGENIFLEIYHLQVVRRKKKSNNVVHATFADSLRNKGKPVWNI